MANNNDVTSGRRARKFSQLSGQLKIVMVIGIIAIIGVSSIIGVLVYNNINAQAQAPAPAPQSVSYVGLTDHTSLEVLDKLCKVSILGNKEELDEDEIYNENFYESVVTEKYPEDIAEDLSDYDYVIIRINPDEATDGYWTLADHVYQINGFNTNFNLYAYHESTDIYGNILDRTSGTAWSGATSGNYSTTLFFPFDTATERHWEENGDWVYDDAWADYTSKTQDYIDNERYWRCQPTIFSLADDQTDHTRTGDYVDITETPSIKLDFNTTIGASTSDTAVNITFDCDIEYQTEIVDDLLYLNFLETWDCFEIGTFNFNFEISLGVNITCSNVYVGRILIPGRFFNEVTPTFTSLQTLV